MKYASMFMLIFAAVLALYGLLLWRRPSKNLLPVRAALSVRNKDDIVAIGRGVVGVALAIALVFALVGTLFPGD